MKDFIIRYFEVRERNSSIKIEVLAGISVYFSLAHMFITNPAILNQAGIDISAALFATAVASGITTLAMGLWARLPFVLAPGAEMNSFFAFVVVGILGLTWQQGLGLAFWSGVLCLVFTVIPVRQKIIDAIPDKLKTSISIGVGVFVAMTGLRLAEVIIFEKGLPNRLGDFTSNKALVLYLGLFISLLLGWKRRDTKQPLLIGGKLVAIIVAAVFARIQGISVPEVPQISSGIFSALNAMDLSVILGVFLDPKVLSAFLVLFLIDYFGSLGKFIGLSKGTNILKDNSIKTFNRIGRAMTVDAVGTSIGAVAGTSNIITFVQSLVGIGMGARTGITAVVCAVLMFASLGFLPLVKLIPIVATSGVLIHVGLHLIPIEDLKKREDNAFGKFAVFVAILMAVAIVLFYALDKAMLVGFLCYGIKQIVEDKKINLYLWGPTILLAISVVLQFMIR
jgi:adenine/guanine/hypoxanthine permease